MSLVSIRDLTIGYRGPPLLDSVDCQIEPGQRIGLLGRNGAGKTTLMRLLCGELQPDSGQVIVAPGVHVSILSQDVPRDIQATSFEVITGGLRTETVAEEEQWKIQNDVEQILSRMALDGKADFAMLSSGMKRRVLLARALVSKPNLLLLDEPTNHLDIDAIDWLENFLLKSSSSMSLMFVTHDRMFLRRLATRILEIDRGRIFDWSCDYDTFLRRKEDALAAEEKQDALFDKRLAEEEVWIRKGIKARRTRNEGRVRALKEMRAQRGDRRKKLGTSNLQIQEGRRSGNLVIEMEDVSFSYDGNPIFEDFSTSIMRQEKVGIIGRNGVGKTTLLKILLGSLAPTSGKIKLGTNLEIAYFDQLRDQLDEEATVQENVGQGSDSIEVNGVKKHVLGYLQDFLFPPDRARTLVKFLSGGERNRILLAKLFTQPANVIVLDEPTNDLDAETLELLEEKLVQFEGTVILVSHDRAFLNNVVTSTIVFEPDGLREYVGGYDDWQRQVNADRKSNGQTGKRNASLASPTLNRQVRGGQSRKLNFKQKQELEKLPGRIEAFESEIEKIHAAMAAPEYYQKPGEEISQNQAELKRLESDLGVAYTRWEKLELIQSS